MPSGLFRIKCAYKIWLLTRRVKTWMAAGGTCGLPKMGHDPGGVVRRAKERLMIDRWLQGYSTLFDPASSPTLGCRQCL